MTTTTRRRIFARGWPWQLPNGRFSPFKAAVLASIMLPGLWLVWRAGIADLGPRPLTELIHQTGIWAVRLLLLTLLVTPARQLLREGRLALLRRMLGVAAGTYLVAHFILFMANLMFDLPRIVTEIAKANYLIVGLVALLAIAALLATSTDGMLRRLGGRRWQRLHWLVYPATAFGLWHFFMQRKADVAEPITMMGLLTLLLGYRLLRRRFAAGPALPLLPLAMLVLAAGLLTMAGEAGYYAWRAGPALLPRVLEANLTVAMGLRPGVWVLLAGTVAFLLATMVSLWKERNRHDPTLRPADPGRRPS